MLAEDEVARVAIFGDIQGHSSAYVRALESLHVDAATGHVPEDLIVIQVGDLIHKGPDSEQVVALADRLLDHSPDRYIQLIGNHEGQYLGGPLFWPDLIADNAATTLAEWFVERRCSVAEARRFRDGEVLITHGGLTFLKWIEIGRPASAHEAAALLNEEFWTNPAAALMPGMMLQGEVGPPGVAWPEPIHELYLPWVEHGTVPFDQVHGHASPFSWNRGRWWPGVPRRLRKLIEVDEEARHTSLTIDGRSFVGVDTANGPSDGERPIVPWRAIERARSA